MLMPPIQSPQLPLRARVVLPVLLLLSLGLAASRGVAEDFVYAIYDGFGAWDTRIERFDSNGSAEVFADTFTVRGSNESGLPDPPRELAVDTLGNVWVSTQAHAILRYRPNGGGRIFAAPGQGGRSLAFDAAGQLHAVSPSGKTIRRFSADGTSAVVADLSAALDEFEIVYRFAFDPAGNILFIVGWDDYLSGLFRYTIGQDKMSVLRGF